MISSLDPFQIIQGEKVKTICQVKANHTFTKEDFKISENTVQLFNPPRNDIFFFEKVFNSFYTTENIFEEVFDNYCQAFIEGFNTAFLFFGSKYSDKRGLLEGQQKNTFGLFELYLQNVFLLINQKTEQVEANPAIKEGKFSLRVKAIEFLNDSMSDLLSGTGLDTKQPRERYLTLANTENEGLIVTGNKTIYLTKPEQISDLIKAIQANQLNQPTEFGNLSEKTARLYMVELVQINSLVSEEQNSIVILSKTYFFDFMTVDDLAENYDMVSNKQGDLANRALFSLYNYVLEHRDSRQSIVSTNPLIGLLNEILGKNVYVLSMHCLVQGQIDVTRKTLDLASNLNQIKNYPILNEGNALKLMTILKKSITWKGAPGQKGRLVGHESMMKDSVFRPEYSVDFIRGITRRTWKTASKKLTKSRRTTTCVRKWSTCGRSTRLC